MDAKERQKILDEAAAFTDPNEINDLGVQYLRGNGVEKDVGLALLLLELAAEKDCATAQNNLAILYRDGIEDVAPDANKYLHYLDCAIQNGYDERTEEFVLAACDLTEKVDNAYKWLLKADKYAFPYAEKGQEPFLHVFVFARHIILKLYMGMQPTEMFLDNAKELCSLYQDFYRNAVRYQRTMTEADGASMIQGWINEIIDRLNDIGKHYLQEDQNEDALLCFEAISAHSKEAALFLAIGRIGEAAQKHVATSDPVYSKYFHMMLRIVDQEDDIGNESLYANACHMIAMYYRDGFGTAVDIDRSYEYELMAANHGDESAQNDLKHYKKKLFGGYTYKA